MTLAAEFKWDVKQQLRFWDTEGHPIGPAYEGKGLIFHLPVFSPDGRFVAYKSRSSGLTIFDSQTGHKVKEFASADYPAAFSPDSRRLAVRLANGGVSLLDTTDWQSKALLEYGRIARALNFSPQGLLAVESYLKERASYRIWDSAARQPTADPIQVSSSYTFPIQLSFNRDGRHLLAVDFNQPDGQDRRVLVSVLDTRAGKIVSQRAVPRERAGASATWHPNQKSILVGSEDGLSVWRASDGETLYQLPTPSGFSCYAFQPKKDRLAVGSSNGELTGWSLP